MVGAASPASPSRKETLKIMRGHVWKFVSKAALAQKQKEGPWWWTAWLGAAAYFALNPHYLPPHGGGRFHGLGDHALQARYVRPLLVPLVRRHA